MLKTTCTLDAFASGLASTRTDSWMREHLSVSDPAWSMANTILTTNQADPLRSIVPGVVLQKISKKSPTLLIVVGVVHDTLSNSVSARYRAAKCIPKWVLGLLRRWRPR